MSESKSSKKKSELGKRKAGDHPTPLPSATKSTKHTESQVEESVIDTNRSVTHDNSGLDKEKFEVLSDNFNEEEEECKWKSLEHHGVRFPPFYKPHGVPLLHKGAKIHLNAELEEIANYWAQIIGSEFAEKETVKANFSNEFMKRLNPECGVTNFDDLDFTSKEERANRSTDEKKKEREENAAFEAYYRYCMIDGEREKVSTVMVEPPGIFRGRGEHPLAGKLKSRILPEFVTINVGPDNLIPKCNVPGHSWKAVVSKPECTWLGNFKDENNEKANVKYLFLAADSKIKSKNDRKKYKKAKLLKENIAKIQKDYMKKMASTSELDAQLGTATYLIDKLALRVGNEKGEDEADTVGCCSLRVEHVKILDNNKIELDFLGKDSMRYNQVISIDPLAHAAISRFVKGKKPEEDLFHLINASRLNEYLKELLPFLSAKIFRTYNASFTLQKELGKFEEGPKDEVEDKVKFYKNANREVAKLCNHQRAVPKNYDEQLKKLEEKLQEKKDKLKELENHKKLLKKDKGADKKSMPKTIQACDTAITKAKKSLTLEENKVYEKKENKNFALSTSKINYMDPRISVTWCKNYEVPIERVFEKTLRMKFAWAMNVDPEWKF